MYEVILYGAVLTVDGDYDKGSSRCNALDEEQDRLRLELAKTKIAIRTSIAVLVLLGGAIGWLIDFIYRNTT